MKKSAKKPGGAALSPPPEVKARRRSRSHRYKWCFIIPAYAGKRNTQGERAPQGILSLARCMDSIANQTDPDCRVMIVNDGNSPEMYDLVEIFKRETPHIPITYLQAPYRGERGGHQSVNLALSVLPKDCEFVTILNGDNLLHPSYIERMYTQRDHDIITCMVVMRDLPGITLNARTFERGKIDRLNYAIRSDIAVMVKHGMHMDADCDYVIDCLSLSPNGVGHVFEELATHC